jgi:hypothetical protein
MQRNTRGREKAMPTLGWVVIAVAVLVALAVVPWVLARRRRTQQLRSRFGPEYERTLKETDSKRRGESELESRRARREALDIRALTPAAAERYTASWQVVQGRFLDEPPQALSEADRLVVRLMRERGYQMDDFEQRSADLSVDHPNVVENYRAAHGISLASEHGKASTEDLRQGMMHYRGIFEELLETSTDASRTDPESAQA